jgi:hypothetical protein
MQMHLAMVDHKSNNIMNCIVMKIVLYSQCIPGQLRCIIKISMIQQRPKVTPCSKAASSFPINKAR